MERHMINMDRDWRFHLGEIELETQNSHSESYGKCKAGAVKGPGGRHWDDSAWRVVTVPHDYLAESGFSPDNLLSHGYRTRSNAWYRKTFRLDKTYENSQLLLCFEGTAVNAEFYFNGSLMERSFSAYTETVFDITDRAYFDGTPNVLAVHINGFETEGWWYEGSGIYRHVRLYAKNKLHIAHNGIFGNPVLKTGTKNSWNVEVEATLENSAYDPTEAYLRLTLLDGERIIAEKCTKNATHCPAGTTAVARETLPVSRPHRWDVDDPYLYTLCVEVMRGDEVLDAERVNIGFRTFRIDAEKGFFLNDRPIKIKGTCNHQDHAGVGVAVPDRVQEYRIKRLKEMGCNAYRCSHNLPAKEILDACDRYGLIVMDENRRFEARKEVLEYLDIMVKRDRNHPSVMFWSLFNEEPLQTTEIGRRIFLRMKNRVQQLDTSRIILGAINGPMEGSAFAMDAMGLNYSIHNVEKMHALHPEIPLIGSENNSAVTTRGCYKSDREGAQVLSNYDEEIVPWGQTVRNTWDFVRTHEYFAGIFIWTGFDYRGEPTPFVWPTVSSQFGIMDTCGFPKDSFYFNKACFTNVPMVHLLPHWTHKKGDVVRVMAVSNCDEVELFLNGRSLGRKASDVCTNTPEWQVEFEAGRLSAKAYRNGKCVAKTEQRTAGKPYAIKLLPDSTLIKNDGQDTAVVNVCVVDKKGIVVPDADDLIRFETVGDGFVRGVGNGDPNSHESDCEPMRHLYHGWCQALITTDPDAKALTLRACADGIEGAELAFEIAEAEPQEYVRDANMNVLDGFTVSDVTEEKPDALRAFSDNDMNSLSHIEFSPDHYQLDFERGWRFYRVKADREFTSQYQLRISALRADIMELYADGKLIDRVEGYHGEAYLSPQIRSRSTWGGPRVHPEIRFVIYSNGTPDEKGAGIAGSVKVING